MCFRLRVSATEETSIPSGKPWSEAENRHLIDNYHEYGATMVANYLGRTRRAVQKKAIKLGVAKPNRSWSDEEVSYLRNNYRGESRQAVANHLGRTVRSVTEHAKRLSLTRSQRRYSADDDALIRDAVERARDAEYMDDILGPLAKRLGRSPSAVSGRLRQLGLTLRQGSRVRGTDKFGRRYVCKDGVRVMEHRVVVAESIGRDIYDHEVVHHIDLDKTNNKRTNLLLCGSRSEHKKIHDQLESLAGSLVRAGLIVFNHDRREYELCDQKEC